MESSKLFRIARLRTGASCLTSGGERCFDCCLLISRELEFDDILHSLKLTPCPLKIGHPRWKPAFQPFPCILPFCSRGFGVGNCVPKNTEPNRLFGALGIHYSGAMNVSFRFRVPLNRPKPPNLRPPISDGKKTTGVLEVTS